MKSEIKLSRKVFMLHFGAGATKLALGVCLGLTTKTNTLKTDYERS